MLIRFIVDGILKRNILEIGKKSLKYLLYAGRLNK